MARDFGPFPSKPMYEVVNRRMQRALAEATASTGFAKSGQGAVTAGTGAQLVIAAYPDGALVDGLYVENPTSETVTLTTNSNANQRIDRLVLRLDMAAETIAPFQIVGTPATSPTAPSLVQTAAVFDMPLCQYRFPGSGSAQNPGSIVDERILAGPDGGVGLSLALDASGLAYINHGLGKVPRRVSISPVYTNDTVSGVFQPTRGALSATQIQVVGFRMDGNTRLLGTTVQVDWTAWP